MKLMDPPLTPKSYTSPGRPSLRKTPKSADGSFIGRRRLSSCDNQIFSPSTVLKQRDSFSSGAKASLKQALKLGALGDDDFEMDFNPESSVASTCGSASEDGSDGKHNFTWNSVSQTPDDNGGDEETSDGPVRSSSVGSLQEHKKKQVFPNSSKEIADGPVRRNSVGSLQEHKKKQVSSSSKCKEMLKAYSSQKSSPTSVVTSPPQSPAKLSKGTSDALYGELSLSSGEDKPKRSRAPRRDSLDSKHSLIVKERRRRKKDKFSSSGKCDGMPSPAVRKKSLDFDDLSPCPVARRPSLDDVFDEDREKIRKIKERKKQMRSKSLPSFTPSAERILLSPSCLTKRKSFSGRVHVRFSNQIEAKEIEEFQHSLAPILFYNKDEIGRFRNEAFLEECGLDPADFADM